MRIAMDSQSKGPNLPIALQGHCMIRIPSDESFLLTGGSHESAMAIKDTWYLSENNDANWTFSEGPIMNQKGNVIGVAVANYGKKQGVESFNFGIKSSTLKTFANSNGLKFISPNKKLKSNKELVSLITEATVYLECQMTKAKIEKIAPSI